MLQKEKRFRAFWLLTNEKAKLHHDLLNTGRQMKVLKLQLHLFSQNGTLCTKSISQKDKKLLEHFLTLRKTISYLSSLSSNRLNTQRETSVRVLSLTGVKVGLRTTLEINFFRLFISFSRENNLISCLQQCLDINFRTKYFLKGVNVK